MVVSLNKFDCRPKKNNKWYMIEIRNIICCLGESCESGNRLPTLLFWRVGLLWCVCGSPIGKNEIKIQSDNHSSKGIIDNKEAGEKIEGENE